jgi:glutamine synthetase
LRETMKKTKSVDEAVLKVVRESFKESAPVRFEGNNYSEEWVAEAKKRGLPNLRRTPEALKQMVSKQSRALLTKLGVLTKEELESRYHVRVERYVKDMLIELHTLREIVDTIVVPAAYAYLGQLSESASQSKTAGVAVIPQVATANKVGELVQELQEFREDLSDVIARAEAMHEDPPGQADLLTSEGADTMAEVRKMCDELELIVGDDFWPLPKYREMLFPV